jgi:hypothetical protein
VRLFLYGDLDIGFGVYADEDLTEGALAELALDLVGAADQVGGALWRLHARNSILYNV